MPKAGRRARGNRNSTSRSSLGLNLRRSEGDDVTSLPGVSFSDGMSCSDAFSINDETILINVGGQVFETYISTLNRLACKCKLTNELFLRRHFRSDQGDFFFDRDPDVFRCVLNLLRTGQLHVPLNWCASTLQNELLFWGADVGDVEGCCWSANRCLKGQKSAFQKMEKWLTSTRTTEEWSSIVMSPWQRLRRKIWLFFGYPSSSIPAQIFSWISLSLAVGSVATFCMETYPGFQVCKETIVTSHGGQNSAEKIMSSAIGPAALCKTGREPDSAVISKSLQPHPVVVFTDFVFLVFFNIEFFVRILCSPTKMEILLSYVNILDCFALLPDYLQLIMVTFFTNQSRLNNSLHVLFVLRTFRLYRIFRIFSRRKEFRVLLWMLILSVEELLFVLLYLVVSAVTMGSLIYFAEQRETSDFKNIPIGFWWGLVSMTTVGFGDVVPETTVGILLGSLCMLNGVLILSMTIATMVGNFLLHRSQIHCSLKKICKSKGQSEATLVSTEPGNHSRGRAVPCCI
ncbi:potassium voltage-gated channel subfamily C member 3-like [Liolophura sinensis]|uniref:potassium voltage-gated channel subfamily C member 3-like n=1 Tax=Liolophura sinensis TaxID=3198878 RepID=UPI0031594DDF